MLWSDSHSRVPYCFANSRQENEVLKEYIDNLMGKLGDKRDEQKEGGGSGDAGGDRR